jgi:predicted acyltransferase (DUF342 family)
MVYGSARVFGSVIVYGSAKVYGDVIVYDNARIHGDAKISGDARVYGDSRVSGSAKISGKTWVYADKWTKSPIQIQGSKHFICTPSKDRIMIGCEDHTIEQWLDRFENIGQMNGYSKEEIEEYYEYISLISRLMKKV